MYSVRINSKEGFYSEDQILGLRVMSQNLRVNTLKIVRHFSFK